MSKFIISKSNSMMAFNCFKTVWLSENKKEEKAPITESQKLIFKQGNEVGKLAHKLFNGEEILTPNFNREKVLQDTQDRLKKPWQALYEAGFEYNGAYCRCDVIGKVKGKTINLYEVKSSTSPKEVHFIDLSYQAYILRNNGFKINDIKLAHIRGTKTEKDEFYNKDGVYYFNGKEIEVEKFFKRCSVNEEVLNWEKSICLQENCNNIDEYWSKFILECEKYNNQKTEPKISIGKQCVKDGVECPWYSYCHKDIKKDSVKHLSLSAKKKQLISDMMEIKLNEVDTLSMKDLPKEVIFDIPRNLELLKEKEELKAQVDECEDKEQRKELRAILKDVNAELKAMKDERLTERQSISVLCVQKPRTNVFNKEAIIEHLEGLEFPLSYTDFETINPAIPLFKNTHSYQVLPFQYILYSQEKSGLKRTDYLYNNKEIDPREDFIVNFIKDMPKKGSVIVYNKSYEDKCLRELGEAYPDYKAQLDAIRARLWDLRTPFQNKWFAHLDLEAKNSIKRVLTILAKNFSYHDIEIQKGDVASALFIKYLFDEELSNEERDKLEQDLKDYCGLDGLAMVKILEKLCEIVGFKLK